MAIKLSNLTFNDEDDSDEDDIAEDDIVLTSEVEQIFNTEVPNTLFGDDRIAGTSNDYGFKNVGVLNTDDGNDTITNIRDLQPQFGSNYGIVNSGTLNANEYNDIITGTSRDDGFANSGALKRNEYNDIITGTASHNSILSISLLTIHSIKCLRNGADSIGPDDTYIKVNDTRIWGDYNMRRRQTRSVNSNYSPPNTGTVWVELWDCDGRWWRDDSMGGFTAINTGGQIMRQRVSGSGSTYDVYYSAWGV